MGTWYEIPDGGLSKSARKQLKQLRKARLAARKDARSGNPAKRHPALRAVAVATEAISLVYRREARR